MRSCLLLDSFFLAWVQNFAVSAVKEETMEYNTGMKTQFQAQAAKPASGPVQELPQDTRDRIQFRAYQIYLSRNRQGGHELDDWLQAEHEVASRN